MHNLLARLEAAFPTRLRSAYLGGSYSDGTAVGHDSSPNSSDVDLFVIFRGTLAQEEHASFERLVAACQLTSPVQVDAHVYAEDDLLHPERPEARQISFLNALIQVSGVLVYGDDLRPDLPAIPFSRYVLDVIESGVFHLGIPRQREALAYPLVTPLVPPLAYPNPALEFYGYEEVPVGLLAPPGTRVLVALTTWMATLILALETGHYAGQKSQSLRLCQQYLPTDRRIQLAATTNELCKGTWGYALPARAEDRMRLRKLCHETVALENEYLRMVHDYLLAQLQQGSEAAKRQVMRILQSVVYQDKELLAAVTSWQERERS